jgi:5-hydroxyisourate hydrolase
MSLSTHVLDTAVGRPATGVPVRLERATAEPGGDGGRGDGKDEFAVGNGGDGGGGGDNDGYVGGDGGGSRGSGDDGCKCGNGGGSGDDGCDCGNGGGSGDDECKCGSGGGGEGGRGCGSGGTVWTVVASRVTDADGRVRDLPAYEAGRWRLVFDTAAVSAFFPEVTVTFVVADPAEHHHVPLLLAPYGYSTYRGS